LNETNVRPVDETLDHILALSHMKHLKCKQNSDICTSIQLQHKHCSVLISIETTHTQTTLR